MSKIPDGFERVSRRRRCPICGKPDWCLLAIDGTKAICPRTPSKVEVGREAGWLHELGEDCRVAVIRRPLRKPPPRENAGARVDWGDMTSVLHRAAIDANKLWELSESIGVTEHSLCTLVAGWHSGAGAFSFPMYDADFNIIGIRLRRSSGPKFAVTGSSNGLFIPTSLAGEGPVYIVEGPTDTAAVLDFGLDGIGRPSCSACVDMTAALVRRLANPSWVIIEDHDAPKTRPNGTVFYPGQDGAAKLADALAATGKPGKVIAPLRAKDTREWKAKGATRQTVEAVVRETSPFRRKA